ncbi:DNA polymerase phi-domain-containing protein [Abortiporus biennis]|nr:DNA polymerase phi-domain-containing protein [Abortiporus biennis]
MSTTLPLFWHLSSASKKERIDASVKLIDALERFQAEFVPNELQESNSEDDEEDSEENVQKQNGLDRLNAQDVSYSIRRLVRGLASPRESSRLGFAVALTELLSRIDTVTCSQVITLILDSTKNQGSMTGQEERDVMFAQLFGLTSVIQSGLFVRETPLPTSASSAVAASDLASFQEVISQLISLGEKRSWLRESAWWTIKLAADALGASSVSWKAEAFKAFTEKLFVEDKVWTPEKVALAIRLQQLYPSGDWRKYLTPTFKHPELLSTGNFDTSADEDEDADVKSGSGSWKPQVHFVWDMLLDEVLPKDESEKQSNGSFPELFRILVDESLFSSTSSPERKYWGFQIFQKALPRVSAADMPMLFTKNFMRSWINHLSNSDRYLHKIAKQVATDIQGLVKRNPTLGFTLILQLTGVHGSHQFDKLTKTKTVETILTSMDDEGIQNYIKYLLDQVNDEHGSDVSEVEKINARRTWIIDQFTSLIRNGAIPKNDGWVQNVLDWLTVHGLFVVRKKSEKSDFLALRSIASPSFSDDLRRTCREKLLSCLAELIGHSSVVKIDDKSTKIAAVASDGQFWISKVLASIEKLENDKKHVEPLFEASGDDTAIRGDARKLIERLNKAGSILISGDQQESAKGAELLVSAALLHQYCIDIDNEEDGDSETLQSCVDGASRMFPVESKKKKSRKSSAQDEEAPEPVDVLVDNVIGFLEEATAYMRTVANQVFSLLSGSVKESTVDLIVAQLERRNPAELAENEDDDDDVEMDGDEEGDEDRAGSSEDEDSDEDIIEDDEDLDEAEDAELRRKIEEALRVNGIEAATGDTDDESEEELMDDDQMMAIDEQLAAVFKARSDEKKIGKGVDVQREATHYKNRVLDLVETFLKKQPTSPLIFRFILPLVELVASTGSDEKQLADKASGILRARLGKAKEVPAGIDVEQVATILEEVHTRARKAPTSDILLTLNQCSLYLSKALLHSEKEEPVVKAYRQSLADFITRKASRLNTTFIQDFLRRHPSTAWNLRDDLIEMAGKSVNGYRQTQAFYLIHTLINQLSTITNRNSEILSFMSALRKAILDASTKACEEETSSLSAAQMKEILKLATSAARQTNRVSSSESDITSTWNPSEWEKLAEKFSSSQSFKAANGLQNLCRQMVQITRSSATSGKEKSKKRSVAKRKVDTLEEEDGEATKKAKHKKAKKSKA